MYAHILIPTDGSPLANAATTKSLELARTLEARVSVMVVVEPFQTFSLDVDELDSIQTDYERHADAVAQRVLAAAKEEAGALGVECETFRVSRDQPHEAIIDEAAARGCDLIAMASHGRRGVSALMLGSQTLKVLSGGKTPVLVYR